MQSLIPSAIRSSSARTLRVSHSTRSCFKRCRMSTWTNNTRSRAQSPLHSLRIRTALLAGAGALGGLNYANGLLSESGSMGADCGESRAMKDRKEVHGLVKKLQEHFVKRLELVNGVDEVKDKAKFKKVEWKRDGGKHGGGARFETEENDVFARASINTSQVFYDDLPETRVDSATALSVILHPRNPYAPSLHFHISYMQPRGGKAYWRMIADLNPAVQNPAATFDFETALKATIPVKLYNIAKDFGDAYFYIPSLKRFRGASHFFIAKLGEDDMNPSDTFKLANSLAEVTIETYGKIVEEAIEAHPRKGIEDLDRAAQLHYHTLYLFQVLTLDRGTTHGLLAHSDNDVGTLGSLPNVVDVPLLQTWISQLPEPQNELLEKIVEVIPADETGKGKLTSAVRKQLAEVVRAHYKAHPKATRLQARMDMDGWAKKIALAK